MKIDFFLEFCTHHSTKYICKTSTLPHPVPQKRDKISTTKKQKKSVGQTFEDHLCTINYFCAF